MKSINFQRNKSLIRVVNEPTKKVKKRNWDKLIYSVLLITLLCFLSFYLINKGFFVHAQGQVLIDETHIRLTDDVRLLEYKTKEGDEVCAGDTLFAYAFDLDNNHSATTSFGTDGSFSLNASGGEDMWWYKESYNLKKKISLNNIDIEKDNILIKSYQKEIKRLTNEVILDVLPKTRLEYAQNEILRLNTENEKLAAENRELNSLLGTLHPFNNKAKVSVNKVGGKIDSKAAYSILKGATLSNFSGEILSERKFFRTPIDGIVTKINTHQYETALKSEEIMTIHKRFPTSVKAFFEQEDLRYFKEGDVFTITFPDGTVSQGVLKRFFIATYHMPEEFQKKYESTTRAIAADIYPINAEDADKWRSFHKMSVEITKFKYN